MKWKKLEFNIKQIIRKDYWICFFRYIRGIMRYLNGKYLAAIADFDWILNNGSFIHAENLVNEMIGINYACLKNFDKAESFLLKALGEKRSKDDGELFMWLGYVYLVKERYADSLDFFRKALYIGQKGIYRRLTRQQYIRDRIVEIDKILKEKYKEILPE